MSEKMSHSPSPLEAQVEARLQEERLNDWAPDAAALKDMQDYLASRPQGPQDYEGKHRAADGAESYGRHAAQPAEQGAATGNPDTYGRHAKLGEEFGPENESTHNERPQDERLDGLGLKALAELARDAEANDDKTLSLDAQDAIQNRLLKLVEDKKITQEGADNRILQLDAIIRGEGTETPGKSEAEETKTPDTKAEAPGEASEADDEVEKTAAETDDKKDSAVDIDPAIAARAAAAEAVEAQEQAGDLPNHWDDAAEIHQEAAHESEEVESTPEATTEADAEQTPEEVEAAVAAAERPLAVVKTEAQPEAEADEAEEAPAQRAKGLKGLLQKYKAKRLARKSALIRAAYEISLEKGDDSYKLTAKDLSLFGMFTSANKDKARKAAKARVKTGSSPETKPMTSLDGSAESPADTNKTEVIDRDQAA